MKSIALGFFGIVGALLLGFLPFAQLEQWEADADLRLCWGTEPKSLDPAVITGTLEFKYVRSLFEGLVSYDPKNPLLPAPGIAYKWEVSKDKLTYTFYLRENARWSNGDPLTAYDFEYAWRRILDQKVDCRYANGIFYIYIRNGEAYYLSKQAERLLKSLITTSPPDSKKQEYLNAIAKGATQAHLPQLQQLLETENNPHFQNQYKRILKNAQQRPPIHFEDVGIRVLSPHKIQVTLQNQTPYILDIFAFPTWFPVPQKVVEKYGDDWIHPQNIVVNGPFVIKKWKPHYMIILEKNPYYHSPEKVKLQKVACFILDKPITALNYYDTGYLDYLTQSAIPADLIENLKTRPDFTIFPTFSCTYLRFNVTKPPFNNVWVRKAIAMSIDKREIVDVLRGGETPAPTLVPPFEGYSKYQPKGLPYDPETARKYLKKVYPDIQKFPKVEFLMVSSSVKTKQIFTVIRNQLKKNLGITIEPKAHEWQVYLDALSRIQYELAYGGWIGDYMDPNTFIDMFITNGGNNRTGWGNPRYDAWVKKAASLTNREERFAILGRAEKMLLEEECVVVPLYYRTDSFLHKPWVKGIVPNLGERYLLQFLWVDSKRKSLP
ncbi:MAG: peptide ABC transporter substrate-binding protein [Planctomycetota bacterium]|nr:MAG: peptide ABC transporter substrate-binding protein [Planctomycetota bacterium]